MIPQNNSLIPFWLQFPMQWNGLEMCFFCAYPVWVYVVGDRWPHNLRGEKHLLFYTLQSLSVRSVQVPILAVSVPAKSPCRLRGVVNLQVRKRVRTSLSLQSHSSPIPSRLSPRLILAPFPAGSPPGSF